MASIEIRGIPELMAKLGSVQGNAVLRPPMQRAVFRLQAGMAKYPRARAGSRYVRGRGTMNSRGVVTKLTSENLGKKWTTKIDESAGGLVGKVGNNTSYGPFVQSQMFQAAVHQGLWQTDEDVAKKEEAAIVADFERTIGEALAR